MQAQQHRSTALHARARNGGPEAGAVHASNRPSSHTAHCLTHSAPQRHQEASTNRLRTRNRQALSLSQTSGMSPFDVLSLILLFQYRFSLEHTGTASIRVQRVVQRDAIVTSHRTLCHRGTSHRHSSTAPTSGATGTCAAHHTTETEGSGQPPGA